MPPFDSALQLERVPGTDLFLVLRPYTYRWQRKHRVVTVPPGFKSDQASVPKIVLPLIVDNTGKITDAAVPHDFIYARVDMQRSWTKKDADLMFYDAMLEARMEPWRAWLAYRAVRLNWGAAMRWGKLVPQETA